MAGVTQRIPRKTLAERFEHEPSWQVSPALFGDTGADIHDFELYNYAHFLDHAPSRRELLWGLEQLSPLADDALDAAERMTDRDFTLFKFALSLERKGEASGMPRRYQTLLIPHRFLAGMFVAKQCEVPLGAAVIRLMRLEEEKGIKVFDDFF